MQFDETLSYLLSLGHETLTIKLGLRNTEVLLRAVGNPEKSFPAVQIAGTNGKGSTAVMLDSICRAAGIRTGLFTSPHLVSITERIQIDGAAISDADFAGLTAQVKEAAEWLVSAGELQALPTFFEQVTAIALLAFREANVELAILETGLGGRLDSTTAARANIVAITPVAIDHAEYLGYSLAQIAAEKAAIIRSGTRVVVGPQSDDALAVISERCKSAGVKPTFAVDPQHYRLALASGFVSEDGRFRVNLETSNGRPQEILLGLRGRHQIANAAIAVALSRELLTQGFLVSDAAIREGLETAQHPGRLEIWDTAPRLLFDGAHNPAAAQTLRAYLDELITQPITMIFGAMRDKALAEMISILFPTANELILTEIDNPRSASLEMLKSATSGDGHPHLATSPGDAIRIAQAVTPTNGLVCVTGSLYLIGSIQQLVMHRSLESSSANA
jgi:dihydrofolate synthase/folylpolyglutamate synthase